MKGVRAAAGALVATALASGGEARAWVYPEHRDITLQAVQGLEPARRATLDGLWSAARHGHEQRLCESAADAAQVSRPSCLDWAAWPAIAGDHSCSGADMLAIVTQSAWILDVARVGARLREHLARNATQAWLVNALRSSDLRLLRADPEYATRASSNNVHFLLARPGTDTTPAAYLQLVLAPGADPNAIGAYVFYHLAALRSASRVAAADPDQRARAARATLADEAFALHFLEDAFAAGHVAGDWGPQAVRKGTHDYYNERGVEAVTWGGQRFVLEGDAHMRAEDANRAAAAARASLVEVLAAAGAEAPLAGDGGPAAIEPNALDVCQMRAMPAFSVPPAAVQPTVDLLGHVPAAALGEGLGALPRFRAELGPFIGVSAAAQLGWIDRGFATTQTTGGEIGGLAVGVRLGYGLEGVMDQSGDGLAFVDVGLQLETASSMKFSSNDALADTGALTAAVPARTAIALRARMPFWLIPGDLLLGALLVAPFSRAAYAQMAVMASNGGLIPWQTGISTPLGRFQLVFGREVGVELYGLAGGKTRFLMPPAAAGTNGIRLTALRSISFDFPVIEYRPFRSFSLDQASVLVIQLFVGFETAGAAEIISPAGAPLPELQTIYNAGARVAFDWRRY